MRDKLAHNEQIAGSLNYAPVSRIFLVVKADTRMDNVVDTIRKYAEQLMDLDMDALAALVTHMDTVTWSERDLSNCLSEDIGMTSVVFTGMRTSLQATCFIFMIQVATLLETSYNMISSLSVRLLMTSPLMETSSSGVR